MKKHMPLHLPDFYKPEQAQDSEYFPNADELVAQGNEWVRRYNVRPSAADDRRVSVLVIDDQYDFSFPQGTLYVGGRSGTGAMDAHRNLVEFIYHNVDVISEIIPTLDSHVPFQVFSSIAHLTKDGKHPAPHTIISADEYRGGEYQANPALAGQIGVSPTWLNRQFVHYCTELEKSGKYKLYIWPNHCLIGSKGHRLAGVVDAARLFHSYARGAANIPEIKGGNPLTEHYSIFQPEVSTTWDNRAIPGAQKNTRLIERLVRSDVVIIAGEASSHCVKTSIADFLSEIKAMDPKLAEKVYILRDCTAAVVIPGVIDFTDDAEKALGEFQDAGMHVVESTVPINEWDGINW